MGDTESQSPPPQTLQRRAPTQRGQGQACKLRRKLCVMRNNYYFYTFLFLFLRNNYIYTFLFLFLNKQKERSKNKFVDVRSFNQYCRGVCQNLEIYRTFLWMRIKY